MKALKIIEKCTIEAIQDLLPTDKILSELNHNLSKFRIEKIINPTYFIHKFEQEIKLPDLVPMPQVVQVPQTVPQPIAAPAQAVQIPERTPPVRPEVKMTVPDTLPKEIGQTNE
jgi:hypothetical protein